MRTKVLICAAALAVASAFTTMAQGNVYSLNIVGYINIPLVEGVNLVANQLDFDGTGLNNTPANVLGSSLPYGTSLYGWTAAGGWNIAGYNTNRSGVASWTVSSGSMPSLNPGQGFWLSIPAGRLSGTLSNLTTVGQVAPQGKLVNTNFTTVTGGGVSLLSCIVPIAGGLQTVLQYVPTPGDHVYQWAPTATPPQYIINAYTTNRSGVGSWSLQSGPAGSPAEPTIPVGFGFWLNSGPTAAWTNVFTVQ